MKNFFEIITGFFFLLSILVGILFLRGDFLLSGNVFNVVKNILIPTYLIIAGLMVGYLVANIRLKRNPDESKVYTKSFIVGILCGVILALSYMFI